MSTEALIAAIQRLGYTRSDACLPARLRLRLEHRHTAALEAMNAAKAAVGADHRPGGRAREEARWRQAERLVDDIRNALAALGPVRGRRIRP